MSSFIFLRHFSNYEVLKNHRAGRYEPSVKLIVSLQLFFDK